MPRIFGYGEDALTLWVLTSNLPEFLNRLDDGSDPDRCNIFYRPSFGRRGGNKSAEFGEFDAIVSSPKSVYLIESKWDGSSELEGSKLVLRDEQVERHKILHYYIVSWINSTCESWEAYYSANKNEFESNFQGKPFSPIGSRLSDNLEYILRSICDSQKPIVDVLLYIRQSRSRRPQSVEPKNFKLVVFEYYPVNESGILEMLSY
jgi:hypothetical protein